ncbi:hypothetical protein [Proteiniclasticum ruminis]|uniref:hypothetical protein n=1 Tax=Proteiniclasticum ruminis TaxID=398199 RepID=UPI0028A6F28F|nr:hypothetical protein [Proteiniclasticum ruminis]
MIWTLIVFTVLSILMSSMFFLTRQDLKETVALEERLQTYYIASAGIDLTYAALMDPSYDPKKIESAINEIGNSGNKKLVDTITIKNNGVVKGTAVVTISRVTVDDKKWIQVVSVGKLVGKATEVTSTMRINEENTNQIVRQKFGE